MAIRWLQSPWQESAEEELHISRFFQLHSGTEEETSCRDPLPIRHEAVFQHLPGLRCKDTCPQIQGDRASTCYDSLLDTQQMKRFATKNINTILSQRMLTQTILTQTRHVSTPQTDTNHVTTNCVNTSHVNTINVDTSHINTNHMNIKLS